MQRSAPANRKQPRSPQPGSHTLGRTRPTPSLTQAAANHSPRAAEAIDDSHGRISVIVLRMPRSPGAALAAIGSATIVGSVGAALGIAADSPRTLIVIMLAVGGSAACMAHALGARRLRDALTAAFVAALIATAIPIAESEPAYINRGTLFILLWPPASALSACTATMAWWALARRSAAQRER